MLDAAGEGALLGARRCLSVTEEDRLRVTLVSSGLDPDGLNCPGSFAVGQRSDDN